MIIQINNPSKASTSPPEWAMVELNGDLSLPEVPPTGDKFELGSLRFTANVRSMTITNILKCGL